MAATMSFTKVGLVTLAVLMLTVGQGSALNCWACTSTSDKACNDAFNKTHMTLQDCSKTRSQSAYSSYSTAVCKKLKYTENEDLITVRKCDWIIDSRSDSKYERSKIDCATSVPSYGKVEYCDTCTENGCNGSNRDVIASTWCAFVPLIIYMCSKKTV